MYLWLLTTETDNGLCFYNIFATKELAMMHLEDTVPKWAWEEDVSGDLKYHSDYSYFISQEPYTPENHCGGCSGLGSHRKHCQKNPNYDYKLMLADRAESVADSIGANNTGASNHCYAAAGLLRQQVREQRIATNFKPVAGDS